MEQRSRRSRGPSEPRVETESLGVHKLIHGSRQLCPHQLAKEAQILLNSLSMEKKTSYLVLIPHYMAEVTS